LRRSGKGLTFLFSSASLADPLRPTKIACIPVLFEQSWGERRHLTLAAVTSDLLSFYTLWRVSSFVLRPITNLTRRAPRCKRMKMAGREWGILLLLCVNITAGVCVYITPSVPCNSTAESPTVPYSHAWLNIILPDPITFQLGFK